MMKHTLVHAAKFTDIFEHLTFLHDTVVAEKAKTVIELGTRSGESTVAFLEALEETGGHLTSVDIGECNEAKALIEGYGLANRWTFVQYDDVVFGSRWDRSIPVDVVFIDTSHLYEHTKREIPVFDEILKPGGVMLFHDTVSFPDGVLKPIQEFLQYRPNYKFENRLNCNGLGILRKPA